MIKLPPSIRTVVAQRLYESLAPRVARSRWPAACQDFATSQPVSCWGVTSTRDYATVHADHYEKLWSQHGSSPSTDHHNTVARNGEDLASKSNGSTAEAVAPLARGSTDLDEQERLLNLLQRRRRSMPSSRRRVHAQRIQDALSDKDPISALTKLAHDKRNTEAKEDARIAGAHSMHGGTDVKANVAEPAPHVSVGLVDLEHVLTHMPLPNKQQYPGAPEALFQPKLAGTAINGACGTLKIPMQVELDFAPKEGLSRADLNKLRSGIQAVYVCTLKLEINDICDETVIGEGLNKVSAKQTAWLQLVSKLHTSGALKELFPSPDLPSERAPEALSEEEAIEPSDVDQRTKEEEKDAKTEIYNYAASLGMLPHFVTKEVQPRIPRVRGGRVPKKPKPVFQVTINLEGQGINVSAVGKDLTTAEVAAAVAFKQQAEKQHLDSDGQAVSASEPRPGVLNVETARSFFAFYKSRGMGLSLEIEHESVSVGTAALHSARLTIDGNPAGEAATMRTKKKAESIAYLTAAVEIAFTNPDLLHEFEQTLKKGKGKVVLPVSSVDLQVGPEALQGMRNAVLEARSAGLPDTRQSLSAETAFVREGTFRRQQRLTRSELAHANEDLIARQMRFESNPSVQDLRSKKAALPMNNYRDQAVKMINSNQYSIVVGATGSGKTTQVPQILFEDAISRGSGGSCNIVCTQPRRIAATSVAQRVAVERNETLRTSVGYQVRFDAKLPYKPYGITYCTTGVLLEKLKADADEVLDTSSHIMIDEVHERDLNIDFLMIVLKKAIRRRLTVGKAVPKVVLMSATLDTELFAKYFAQIDENGSSQACPSITVPGRTFPVKEKYLGSIMHELLQAGGPDLKAIMDQDPSTNDYLKAETAFSAAHGKAEARSSTESVIDWKRERQPVPGSTEEVSAASDKEEALVPVSLLAATIAQICSTSQDGAVLAFVPGLDHILATQKMLLQQPLFGQNFADKSKFQICLLHSTVPKEQQAEIFEPSPPGCRKIILSTNIAETSVTVTEVKYVVDTGKLREKRYDQVSRITKLQCVWVSKSNSRQRAGRAGRVQDGFYYALYSKERSDALRAVGLPELLRSDLQETCLSIKAQSFDEPVASFLAQAIEPPSKQAVDAAIKSLVAIEAYTDDERLTALGRLLSRLPVHPSLGKMIILGVVFRCLDPMLILGAAAEQRSLFVTPIGSRQEASRAHRSYLGESKSDHIAFLEAFRELRLLRHRYGVGACLERARESFLHNGAFRTIDQTAKQIEQILVESGLIRKSDSPWDEAEYGPADLNRNAGNTELVKCLLLAGVHPNLAVKTSFNGLTYRTPQEPTTIMHPSSLNGEMKQLDKHPYGALFAYSTLARSNDGKSLFVRDSTYVTPLMAVLFGGHVRMSSNAKLEMDDWLPFFVKSHDRQFATKLILEFRKALDRVLNGAFSSLSDVTAESRGLFANDPIREKFADRLVEVLGSASSPTAPLRISRW